MQIDGGPVGSNSLVGVKFIAGGTLEIQNCTIRNFTAGGPNGYGVWVANSNNNVNVLITDTTFTTDGLPGSGTGGGVFIQPSGTVGANVTLERVVVVNSTFGVRADATLMTAGTINLSINHSDISNNTFAGVASVNYAAGASSGGAAITHVSDSTIANNGIGLNANGSNSIVRVGASILTGNAQLDTVAHGATMTSYGTNQIHDNPIATPITIAGPS
jgi:hypothetical protein